MASLERLLELVRRTGLPLVVPSQEGSESCVLMPLGVYERLGGKNIASTAAPTESVQMVGPTLDPVTIKEVPSVLRLQDVLQESISLVKVSTLSATSATLYEEGGLEDCLAVDDQDVKIFPQTKQKTSPLQPASDEFGPTLA